MNSAPKMGETAGPGDAVVDLVAVAHERGAGSDARIQLLGVHGAAPRCIGEQPNRRPDAIHLRPHVALGLRLAPRFLEHLHGGFVPVDQVRVQQVIAQKVNHRLHGLADAHDTGGRCVAGEISTEAAQQRCRAVQGHADW